MTFVEATHTRALSVIIPIRGSLDDLERQLEALVAQHAGEESWEVVVADNGVTGDLPELIERFHRSGVQVRRVDATGVAGQAAAINVAARAASGDVIVLLDADDQVAPGYLDTMWRALQRHDFAAGRLDIDTLNPDWLRRSRPAPQSDGLGAPFGFLPSAAGCAIGVRRAAFDRVGGLDPTIREGNDVDFSWRLQLAGFSPVFVPDAVVHYRYRASLGACFRQARAYGAAGPALYRRYRLLGMPRRSLRRAIRFHAAAIVRLLSVRSRADLAAALFLLGYRVGLIQGSIRHRVRYL